MKTHMELGKHVGKDIQAGGERKGNMVQGPHAEK
jgi:hypothetical protein